MIAVLIFDLSKTILFPKDRNYQGSLNGLNKSLSESGLQYKFLDYFELDQDLLNFLVTIKDKYRLILYTSENIQNEPEIHQQLIQVFEKIYSGLDMGKPKDEAKSYTSICELLSVLPSSVLFIDDSQTNTEAANSAGLNTLTYTDLPSLKARLLSM